MRVLPSRQTIVCTGGAGSGTGSEMPCLKKKSCSARSLSPTTVSPFGPGAGLGDADAHLAGLLEALGVGGDVEHVDPVVLPDLLVVEALC